jgi:hypothetical protein
VSTQLIEDHDVDTTDNTEEGKAAHIVKRGDDGRSATQIVLEARIYGYPVEALCGKVFIPQRDPKQLPMCSKCKEIGELYQLVNGYKPPVE